MSRWSRGRSASFAWRRLVRLRFSSARRPRFTDAVGRGAAVEIVQLLDRRHPEIRMELELVVEPARAALLRADAEEVRAAVRAAREAAAAQAVRLFSPDFAALPVFGFRRPTGHFAALPALPFPLPAARLDRARLPALPRHAGNRVAAGRAIAPDRVGHAVDQRIGDQRMADRDLGEVGEGGGKRRQIGSVRSWPALRPIPASRAALPVITTFSSSSSASPGSRAPP